MFVWLMVCLKVPIAALLYLVYWASRAPEPDDQQVEPARLSPDPPHPRTPRWPSPPRRGPHADPLPVPPKRIRARGRRLLPAKH